MGLTEEQMVDRLRLIYEAFNRSDFDAVIEKAHPEIVLIRAGGAPGVSGAEAVRGWMEPDAFESQVLEPLDFQVEGSRVMVYLVGHMRGAGSGIELDIRSWTVWTFGEDDLIVRVEVFLDHEKTEAQRALTA